MIGNQRCAGESAHRIPDARARGRERTRRVQPEPAQTSTAPARIPPAPDRIGQPRRTWLAREPTHGVGHRRLPARLRQPTNPWPRGSPGTALHPSDPRSPAPDKALRHRRFPRWRLDQAKEGASGRRTRMNCPAGIRMAQALFLSIGRLRGPIRCRRGGPAPRRPRVVQRRMHRTLRKSGASPWSTPTQTSGERRPRRRGPTGHH